MAPDVVHLHALPLQCDLTQVMVHLSAVKMSAHSPVTLERPVVDPPTRVSPTPQMSPTFPLFRNLQHYLWGAFQRVLHRLWAAKDLFYSTRVSLFLCNSYRPQVAMKVHTEKSIMGGAEVEKVVERCDQTSASMLKTLVEEKREVLRRMTMEVEEEEEERETEDMDEFTDEEEEEENEDEDQVEEEESESDWMEWESEEEEDDDVEDEDALHQQTAPTTGSCVVMFLSLNSMNSKQANEDEEEEAEDDDDEDSDWSEDDDDDSEASAESVELWESFLQGDDPYNPLSFSSCTTSKSSSNTHTSPAQENAERTCTSPVNGEAWEEEEGQDRQHSTHSNQQKKVRFSDEVTVCPLVDWAQASREARDGSCWMEMARDRDRFRRRVEDAGKVISPFLSHEHRRLVWERLQKQAVL